MLAPSIANLVHFFYPIGNTPAVSLTQDLPSDSKADILLLGCGDVRHVLFTINNEQDPRRQRPLDFTCCDVDSAVIARNILLLSMILDDVEGTNEDSIWNLFYHLRVDGSSLDLLQSQATRLLSVSTSLESWHGSQYGQHVRICDHTTLERVRDMWHFYGAKRKGDDLSSYKKKIESGIKTTKEYMKSALGGQDGQIITGIRAASPACLEAVSSLSDLYKDYWKFGTTDTDPTARSHAVEYNPMFSPSGGNMFLHYGTDPLLGFHLGASYAPLKASSPLSMSALEKPKPHEIVATARREFRVWMQSFKAHSKAGLVTLRFFAGDAVAFAYALQQVGTTGSSKNANCYRDRYHFDQLDLSDDGYSGGSAPTMFDVIDTSNLSDHLGALNLLTATSPLLRNNMTATLYSEKLVQSHGNHKELIETILCGDLTTVSSLLGLTPVEVSTNTAPFSSGDESLAGGKGSRQLFARIAWKRPLSPNEGTHNALAPIIFDPAQLAHALFRIYLSMFADEDVTKMMSKMQTQGNKRPTLPTYHRASFVALLCLVKSRTTTDWNQTMESFLQHLNDDHSLAFSDFYMQEMTLWMHMMGLYTVQNLREKPRIPADYQDKNVPNVVCVTLQVPRSKLDPFIKESIEKGFTPPLQCVLQSSPQAASQWQNMFAATQIGFGSLTTKGTRHTDSYELVIDEDQLGWSGKSSMFVSFYVPTWILLQENQTATVSLALPHSPHTLALFSQSLGRNLNVFITEQQDVEHVYVTNRAPNQSKVMSIGGFASENVKNEVDPKGGSETTITASVGSSGHISSFTSHIQILSEEAKATLRDGKNVSRSMQSPFNHILSLEQGPNYRANFPAPVLNSTAKVRVARKSSYVELVAEVAKPNDWSTFKSFMYPVFLDSGSPVPWNMPRLNLSSLPTIDVSKSSSARLQWLRYHLPTMWSAQESALKFNHSLPASPTLRAKVDLKDSLYHMFMGFSGIEPQSGSVYAINCQEQQGVQMVFFISNMRLDLSNRTVVLDAAVLPLRLELMAQIMPALKAMAGSSHAPAALASSVEELQLWKEALPSWTERSRTWSHKSSCEYLSIGKIPISTGFGERVLCSCGEGELPTDFMPSFPGWKDLAKHAVRVSISPSFSSALIDSPIDISSFGSDAEPPKDGCRVCGKSSKPDGSELMNCSRCHVAQYCSRDCQRNDWKKHKVACKADGN